MACACLATGGVLAFSSLSSIRDGGGAPSTRTLGTEIPGKPATDDTQPPLVTDQPSTAATATRTAATPTVARRLPQATASAGTNQTNPTARPRTGAAGDSSRQTTILERTVGYITDDYVYPDYGGLNPKVEAARIGKLIGAGLSDDDFYIEMKSMINRLNDHHSTFITPQELKAEESQASGFGTYVGFGIDLSRSEDNTYAYLTQVLLGSPAAKAGLKQHEHILQVDGRAVIGADGHLIDIGGDEGSVAVFTMQVPGSTATRDVKISRAVIANRSRVEFRLLASTGAHKIGYLYIPGFDGRSVNSDSRDGLRGLMKLAGGSLDGLVVDMRNNGGGDLTVLQTHLGFFTSGVVGYGLDREETKTNIICKPESIGNSQTVPLIILTSKYTASFGEVFAGALQGLGRAKTVGQSTAGFIEELLPYDYPDGSELLLAIRTFHLPDGRTWARKGLLPDMTISSAWDQVTIEDDPVISAAVKALG